MIMNFISIPLQCCMQRSLLVGKLRFFYFYGFDIVIYGEPILDLKDCNLEDILIYKMQNGMISFWVNAVRYYSLIFDYRLHSDCFWNCLHWLLEDVRSLPSWKAYIIFNHICWLFGVSIMIPDLSIAFSIVDLYNLVWIWGFGGRSYCFTVVLLSLCLVLVRTDAG